MAPPVIFLDIDGVLLTGRAWEMPVNAAARELARRDPEAAALAATFDPRAVRLLNGLVADTGAKLVIASHWRYSVGTTETLAKVIAQGVPAGRFHEEWCCPVNPFRRDKWHDIRDWLGDNRTTPLPLVAPAYPWPEEQQDGWEQEYATAMVRHRAAVDDLGFPFVAIDDEDDLPGLVRTMFHDGLTVKICNRVRRELAR